MISTDATLAIHNRPNEWRIEQGLSARQLPYLDQTGPHHVNIHPEPDTVIKQDAEAIAAVGDRDKLFASEKEGWKG